MSNLLQSHSKLYGLLLIYLFIGFAESLELGVSPASLDFEGSPFFEECKTLKIISDDSVFVNLSIRWTEDGKYSKKISDYSRETNPNLNVVLPSSLNTGRTEEAEICIETEKEGYYSGILFFDVVGKSSSVGVWINVGKNSANLEADRPFSDSSVSGKAVFDEENGQNYNFGLFFFVSFFCFLEILILVFLFVKFRRKVREKGV